MTGIEGQSYRSCIAYGGPALFVYYGPALLQSCGTPDEMTAALSILASVYRAGRCLWPLTRGGGTLDIWVLEGSLAVFLVRREAALDLVCGADFSCKLMRGRAPAIKTGPGDRFRSKFPEKPGRKSPAGLPSGTQKDRKRSRNVRGW